MTEQASGRLLSREDFRDYALQRDQDRCVRCGDPATAVHHILERKLFSNGGYYLGNAASLCDGCHWQAELTIITCDQLREDAGITEVILPEGWDESQRYDKWGNVILPSGNRLPGPLFDSEQFQKILRTANLFAFFQST